MYYRFGFADWIGGNAQGLEEDYYDPCDAEEVPALMSCSDDAGPAFKLQERAKLSGVPHVFSYRDTNYDVPLYHLDPSTSAGIHRQAIHSSWPPELEKKLCWNVPINEVDKNRAVWLAQFAKEWALPELADPNGLKMAFFAWSAGEPEPDHWESPEMLEFLELCAANPERLAIALHEYSYNHASLQDSQPHPFPYQIGRFQFLFAACDRHGIRRPTVLITEFGWGRDGAPAVPEIAMQQLEWAQGLYAPHTQIKMANIWGTGGQYGGIANIVQKYIAPIGARAVEYGYEPPTQQEPRKIMRVAHLTPQDTSQSEMDLLTRHLAPTKTTFTHSHDDIEATMFHGTPQSEIHIWEPERWGQDLHQEFAWLGVNLIDHDFDELTGPTVPIVDVVDSLPQDPNNDYPSRPLTQVTSLVIHHTATPLVTTLEAIANYHVNIKGWPGIGYHFVIRADGTIFLTNYLQTMSYHAGAYNPISIGIALLGDYTYDQPTNAQITSANSLVSYLQGQVPSAEIVEAHGQLQGMSTQCPGLTWESWFWRITGDQPPEPPDPPVPPPGGQKKDLRPVFAGTFTGNKGPLYEVQTEDGPQQRHQTHREPGGLFYFTKGGDGPSNPSEWEELKIADGYIWRRRDTSPGGENFYDLKDAGREWSRWSPAVMAVGEIYQREPLVISRRKSDCHENWNGYHGTRIQLVSYNETVQFFTGETLDDVSVLHAFDGGLDEWYWISESYGLVGWQNPTARSAISEIHAPGTRPDNVREVINCPVA